MKNIDTLIEQQRPGYSLDQPFYTDNDIFKLDLEKVISPQWQFVDHISRIPDSGDYITYEIANESIIILRDKNGEVRAYFNVCRHRGSRICAKSAGNTRKLVCP